MARSDFGDQLREWRCRAGLSQLELATAAGLSLAAVRDLEQGRTRHPSRRSVLALVDALALTESQADDLRRSAGTPTTPGTGAAVALKRGALRVAVLGPLTVHRGPVELRIGGPRRRTVLALLALGAPGAVPTADLVEAAWGVDASESAAAALHTHVSRLRSVLAPPDDEPAPDRLRHGGGGYRLSLSDGELDLAEFRRLVRRASASPDEALALEPLEAALALWRGEALADLPQLHDHVLVRALARERVDAALNHADLVLRLSLPERSLPMLRPLAEADPLHEALHARLIRLLAAAGRQAEALATFESLRRRLADELGVGPSAELAAAHRWLLRPEPAGARPPATATQSTSAQSTNADRPTPSQLPPAIEPFVGRQAELHRLDRHAAPDAAARLAAIAGTAGVGKTTLAVVRAHRVADRVPDGQRLTDLRVFDAGRAAVDPVAVLEHRRRLGLTQEELAERAGLAVRTIRDLESGRVSRPRPATLRLLARAFQLDGEEHDRFCAGTERGPAAWRPPAQLPAGTVAFTGRRQQLRLLDATLPAAASAAGASLPPVLIVGGAGVGKTALAVHWAHQIRDRFPDGQLFVDLHGYAATAPLPPARALAHMLGALGIAAERIPADEDGAVGVYRTAMADRRMLIVLDNAYNPDQVRPLLPGTPRSLVLITSRSRLGGLVAVEGANRVVLDRLEPDEAITLLAKLIDGDRMSAEPAAVDALAKACDRLPLALRIAAANLADEPHRAIAGYVRQLADGRVAGLRVTGDDQAAVGVAFALSYRRLEPRAQRLFRLLGVDPSVDCGPESAAALADIPFADASQLLAALADAHLLDRTATGRYACHDLIRCYARDLARHEETAAERDAALRRLLEHHLRWTGAAADAICPQVLRLPPPAGLPPARFGEPGEALRWLDGERINLVAAVTHTVTRDHLPLAWALADALRGYFANRMYLADWLATARAALAAGRAACDAQAQASAELSLGLLHWRQGRAPDALGHYTEALAHASRAGWLEGQAATLVNMGAAHMELGNLDESAGRSRHALVLHRQTGRIPGQAAALGNLGLVHLAAGRLTQATKDMRQAIELNERLGSSAGTANGMTNLGVAYRLLGLLPDASAVLASALRLHRAAGNRGNEAETLAYQAMLQYDLGRHAEAMAKAEEAVRLARDVGHRLYEAIALNAVAAGNLHDGDPEAALRSSQRARAAAIEVGGRYVEAEALVGLAAAQRHLGRYGAATADLDLALGIIRVNGYRLLEGQALTVLAGIHHDRGHVELASRAVANALAIHLETGHRPGVERCRRLLPT